MKRKGSRICAEVVNVEWVVAEQRRALNGGRQVWRVFNGGGHRRDKWGVPLCVLFGTDMDHFVDDAYGKRETSCRCCLSLNFRDS